MQQLIGMLDSPFTRRVAIAASWMEIPFAHQSISILREMDRFRQINPLLKVPTWVFDDGEIMVDSTLILDTLSAQGQRALLPADPTLCRRAQQYNGIALVAAEKAVQHLWQTQLRPTDRQYASFITRYRAQLDAAWQMLEPAAAAASPWLCGEDFGLADITLAVAWRFVEFTQPGLSAADSYPAIAALTARAEALPQFLAWPIDRA